MWRCSSARGVRRSRRRRRHREIEGDRWRRCPSGHRRRLCCGWDRRGAAAAWGWSAPFPPPPPLRDRCAVALQPREGAGSQLISWSFVGGQPFRRRWRSRTPGIWRAELGLADSVKGPQLPFFLPLSRTFRRQLRSHDYIREYYFNKYIMQSEDDVHQGTIISFWEFKYVHSFTAQLKKKIPKFF